MDNIIFTQAVEKYQCPGCVAGSDTTCGKFRTSFDSKACDSHVAGTALGGVGRIYLGMPTGFDKVGQTQNNSSNIRIFSAEQLKGFYDIFNVPVWFQEIDGNLFVRCFCPRINISYVDIFIGGKADDISIKAEGSLVGACDTDTSSFKPINVADFAHQID